MLLLSQLLGGRGEGGAGQGNPMSDLLNQILGHVTGRQSVYTPGGPKIDPNSFGPGFPAANPAATPTTAPDREPAWSRAGFDPGLSNQFNLNSFYGTAPPVGSPGALQGTTQIPTFFDSQGYPFAVPVQPGEYQNVWSLHTPQRKPT
jgi:hypothetical protein